MADKNAQIEALLTGQLQRLILAEGYNPKERSAYATVFDVTRAEIDAYVASHGVPASVKFFTRDAPQEGLYLVRVNSQWQLYYKDRGSRYDEEIFTDERSAQTGLVNFLLRACGPDFVHLLGCDEAILQFSDWDRPWLFPSQVASILSAPGKNTFKDIWCEATDARHWTSANLVACGQRAEQALRKRFPTLNDTAINAVVRAASYQWR